MTASLSTGLPPVAMHLAPLHPDDKPSPLSSKDSYLSSFPGEPVIPNSRRRSWRTALPSWETTETVVWAAIPLAMQLLGCILLLVALFSNSPSRAYMTVKEVNGTARLDYYILNACGTASGSTERYCTPHSSMVNFSPAISKILPLLPGVSAFKLPLFSEQTPSIFITTLALYLASLVVYLPFWTLAYFPAAPLPSPIVRFYRYFSRKILFLAGAFAFCGFVFATTIGVGYKLYLMGFADDFAAWYCVSVFQSGSRDVRLHASVGSGFDYVWAAAAFGGLNVIASNVAMHNGLDERVMWPEQQRRA
ncbi:hypothetical protein JCM10207_005003 [Rhodosporidiobolus poonsookiae]